MEKYKVVVYNNSNEWSFNSDSADTEQHLRDYSGEQGGGVCKVYEQDGEQIAECRYSDEDGFYACEF